MMLWAPNQHTGQELDHRRVWFSRAIFLLALLSITATSIHCKEGAVGDRDSGGDNCDCLNPLDHYEDGLCWRTGSACTTMYACDPGYECMEGVCFCVDPQLCGVACSSACSCPVGFDCDTSAGHCRPSRRCLDDRMCPEHQACQSEGSHHGFVCTTPSGAGVGEPCETSTDCESGICSTNICLQPCQSNASCPSGQVCQLEDGNKPACVVVTTCTDCDQPNQICNFRSCLEGCRTNADCPGDLNCKVHLILPLFGVCDDSAGVLCDADEFITSSYLGTRFCLIYASCWFPSDCPTGYDCYTSSELESPVPGDPSFCAREL